MTDETNPESSPSLAAGWVDPEKELNERALAAAEALIYEFHVGRFDCFRHFEFHNATREEIAAVLRPFLQSNQNQ